jgi:hypothetical protein
LFLIHSRPILDNSQVEVAIPLGSLFETFLECFRAGRPHVVFDGLLNETAALAARCSSIDRTDGFFREHDIDSLRHEIAGPNPYTLYPHPMWIETAGSPPNPRRLLVTLLATRVINTTYS